VATGRVAAGGLRCGVCEGRGKERTKMQKVDHGVLDLLVQLRKRSLTEAAEG
jgi:hypothetical protein